MTITFKETETRQREEFKRLSSLHDLWVGGAALGGADEVDGLTLGGGGRLGVDSGAAGRDEHGEVDGGGVQVRARACLLEATLEHAIVPLVGGAADGQVVAPLLRHQVHSVRGAGWSGSAREGDDEGQGRVMMRL